MAGYGATKRTGLGIPLFVMMFMISMFWNTATATGEAELRTSAPEREVPAIFVSSDPEEWSGRLERDDRFKMSTRLLLPDGLSEAESSQPPVVTRVTFVLDTVLSCDASVADDGRTLTLTGRIPDRFNARDIVLDSVSLELPDGTVCRQDDIFVCLTETRGYHYYDSGGGCDVGPGVAAILLLLPLWRRRKIIESKH